jgi:hypothetical protein
VNNGRGGEAVRCNIISLHGDRCPEIATDFWEIDGDAGINCCKPDYDLLQQNWEGEVVSQIVSDWRRMNELLAQAQLVMLGYAGKGCMPSFEVVWEGVEG